MENHNIRRHAQQGGALIILVLILVIAGTTALFSVLDGSGVKIERDKKTAVALAEAKSAIIGWSSRKTTLTQLGQLPCPEDTGLIGSPSEGTAQSSCTSVTPVIGRLPWRTLGLGDLRDGNGEKLWYVISPGFRTNTINSDNTPPQLMVDGIAGSAVAIVFSPGSALAGQVRPNPTAGSPPDVTQYLDLSNGDGTYNFVTSGVVNSFNDKLLAITHSNLFAAVNKRVVREAINCLNIYAVAPVANPGPPPPVGTYPWPAPLNTTAQPAYVGITDTFFGRLPDNPMGGNWSGACSIPVGGTGWWLNWKEMVFFAIADGYKPTIGTPGCGDCLTVLPTSAIADKHVVVLLAGQALAGQVRASVTEKGTLSKYLESGNASGGVSFIHKNPTATFNDVVVYQ